MQDNCIKERLIIDDDVLYIAIKNLSAFSISC